MKKKRWIISLIILVVLLVSVGIIIYNILSDKNKLTSEERKWINSNINSVQNVNVIKDENIFSKDGKGVFYNFLNSFAEEYGMKVNPVIVENSTDVKDNSLIVKKNVSSDDKIFYTDHYVLISKNSEIFSSNKDLEKKTIGVLNSELSFIQSYLKDTDISFNGFETEKDLFDALGSNVSYIILPRMKYIDSIIANNLNIVYHLDDITYSYVLETTDTVFGHVLEKYFNKFQKEIDKNIKSEEFKIFTSALNISDTDVDKLLSIDYHYGFINNSPYEVIMSGNYGGIVSEYLHEFSAFSGVYFDITKYSNINKLVNALNKGKVDLYFAFNGKINSNYLETSNGINTSLSILTNRNNNKMFDSIYGLRNETVYVEENSNLHKYIKNIENIKIETYSNSNELFKLNNKDVIIVMDTYIYDYYRDTKLNNYVNKYDTVINDKYTFKIKNEHETLKILLDRYINYLDPSSMMVKGINSHMDTVNNGSILNGIAKYFILSIILVLVSGFIFYKKSKRIRVAKRIKKDDKIRFIDDLTCLKNRAYLSDFIKTWNNNTIYPQTIIVVGLKKLQEINDKYGVDEGDKQIQAAANALIKTQLDNSDLMRSDGNEFVIYSVGYNKKQIINYIHKLNKEFKKLPYDFGAEFGYSVIENNLKTVEDALSEATSDMKSKKESGK